MWAITSVNADAQCGHGLSQLGSFAYVFKTPQAPSLLPANEVWGKVIFLHLFVILFTGGVPGQVPPRQVHPQTRCIPPDQVHPPGSGTPPQTRYTPWAGTPPRDQVPPRPGTPPDQVHPPPNQVHPLGRYTPPSRYPPPWEQCMLGDMGNKWAVRILLECILVLKCCHFRFRWDSGFRDCPKKRKFKLSVTHVPCHISSGKSRKSSPSNQQQSDRLHQLHP